MLRNSYTQKDRTGRDRTNLSVRRREQGRQKIPIPLWTCKSCAKLRASNALLFNAELRLPLVRYLNSGYISSNFFRNIQFIGFFDVGSSWTGASPFNESNTISTETITEGSYRITIKKFISCLISS